MREFPSPPPPRPTSRNFLAQAANVVNKNGDVYSVEALQEAFGGKANIQIQPNGDVFITLPAEFVGELPKPVSLSVAPKEDPDAWLGSDMIDEGDK